MKKIILTTTVITLLSGCATHSHWGYTGDEAPQNWGRLSTLYATCSTGENQSPINIENGLDAVLPELNFDYHAVATEVVNNGHTIQVNIAAGSELKVAGNTFELKQFHFHTPSENHIHNKSFPLEAHFVHADNQGNLAVVAVMFDEGKENDLLKTIWSNMPTKTGAKYSLHNVKIPYLQMLPENKDYYRYNGSLTTPPCTEGVTWMVLKQPVSLNNAQTQQFKNIFGHANNRPVQGLNARIIAE